MIVGGNHTVSHVILLLFSSGVSVLSDWADIYAKAGLCQAAQAPIARTKRRIRDLSALCAVKGVVPGLDCSSAMLLAAGEGKFAACAFTRRC
jgi:hypothetical protein